MDFLATPLKRRVLFAALYLSEGAPIGFLWLALPTRLKAASVGIEQITALTAALVLPWTFKFAWAPLVDVLRSPRWTLKHWILSAQAVMGLTLAPLIWVNPLTSMSWLSVVLFVHAIAAATQDVAIDALCISVTDVRERGKLNGWMQSGMLAGRAAMGGGALVLGGLIGDAAVVVILVSITTFSGILLWLCEIPKHDRVPRPMNTEPDETDSSVSNTGESVLHRLGLVWANLAVVVRERQVWIGMLFALSGPAAFKAFEVVIGPFLIDHGYTKTEVGTFTAVVMIGAMVLGSISGGHLADRFSRRGFVAASLLFIVACLATLAVADLATNGSRGLHLQVLIAMTAFGIGLFTVALYAMFMDITRPAIAATQFSAFMGATNGCESWSTFTMGRLVARHGYPTGILTLCAVSVCALPLLLALHRRVSEQDSSDGERPF